MTNLPGSCYHYLEACHWSTTLTSYVKWISFEICRQALPKGENWSEHSRIPNNFSREICHAICELYYGLWYWFVHSLSGYLIESMLSLCPLTYFQHHHLSLCSKYLQRKKNHWFSKQHNLLSTVTPGSSSYNRNSISWWCLIWYNWLYIKPPLLFDYMTFPLHCNGVGRNTNTVLRMQPYHLDLTSFCHYCVGWRTS